MRNRTRRRLEMLDRVMTFIDSYPSDDPAFVSVAAAVRSGLERAHALAAAEVAGRAAEMAAVAQRQQLRRRIRDRYLRYAVDVAARARKSADDRVPEVRLPDRHAPNAEFLVAARTILDTLLPAREILVGSGLASGTLDELAADIATFESAGSAAAAAMMQHVGARAQLDATARDCVALVRILGGFNRTRFGDDPGVWAVWLESSHVAADPARAADSDVAVNVELA